MSGDGETNANRLASILERIRKCEAVGGPGFPLRWFCQKRRRLWRKRQRFLQSIRSASILSRMFCAKRRRFGRKRRRFLQSVRSASVLFQMFWAKRRRLWRKRRRFWPGVRGFFFALRAFWPHRRRSRRVVGAQFRGGVGVRASHGAGWTVANGEPTGGLPGAFGDGGGDASPLHVPEQIAPYQAARDLEQGPRPHLVMWSKSITRAEANGQAAVASKATDTVKFTFLLVVA